MFRSILVLCAGMACAGTFFSNAAIAGGDEIFISGFEPRFSVGGEITGLSGLGETLNLSLNGQEVQMHSSDGLFTFSTLVETGQAYVVETDHAGCAVLNGSGVMGLAPVSDVQVDCPEFVTVYDVKQGLVDGRVALSNLLVTSCRIDAGYHVQTVPGDVDFQGSDHSAAFVFDGGADCIAVQPGDRVDLNPADVNDFFGEIQLINAVAAVTATGQPLPAPVLTTPAALVGAVADPLNAVLVEVQNVTVTALPGGDQFLIDDDLPVEGRNYLINPFPEINDTFLAVRGPLSFHLGENKIQPRFAEDLVVVPRLVINEVNYDMLGAVESAEFVELFNPTHQNLNLDDLSVYLVNGSTNAVYLEVPLTGDLPGLGYAVLGGTDVTVPPGALFFLQSDNFIQNGSPDGLAVADSLTETVFDALSYEGEITAADLGFTGTVNLVEGVATLAMDDGDGSLARIANGVDTDNAVDDWQQVPLVTPGSVNTELDTFNTLWINEVDYDNVGADNDEFVEIYNYGPSPVDLTNISLVLVNGSSTVNAEYDRIALASIGVLNPGEYLVVGSPSLLATVPVAVPTVAFASASNSIQNGAPDAVALVDFAGLTVIDALSYEGEVIDPSIPGLPSPVVLVSGTATSAADSNSLAGSIVRVSDSGDDDSDFQFSGTPTPGAANL